MAETLKGLNSLLVHVGEAPDPVSGSVTPPIYQTSTFAFPTNESMADFMNEQKAGYIYTRLGNPNFTVAEAKIARLEGAEKCLVVASGMAAVSTALLSVCSSGDHIIAHADIYGGSFGLLHDLLPRFGVGTTFMDLGDPAAVEAALRPETKVIHLETPSNPALRLADISAIAEVAHRHGVKVIVDNTFATPVNQRPLALGADAVIHSGTKYLNGHSDVIAGAIAGSADFILGCSDVARKVGGTLNAFDAWLLGRGLKTLGLRVARQNENGQAVAEYLARHAAVAEVLYPGLPSHPQHQLAKRQMKGYGGVLSIRLKGGQAAVDRLLDRVELFARAVSLGSVESLITQPVAAVHRFVPAEFQAMGGITPDLVRIAVGIEDPDDLIRDLEQALA